MAFKMAENSLFAILLRSPWWYSVLIALFVIALSTMIARGQFLVVGISLAVPFLGIAGYSAFKQLQRPSPKRVAEVAAQARKMSAVQVAEKIAANYEQNRFEAEKFKGNAADMVLTRGYRKILLCSKRFKAANTGIEPLKQLVAAGENAEANAYLYVALGEISANARSFAKDNDIEFIQAALLAEHFGGKVKIE